MLLLDTDQIKRYARATIETTTFLGYRDLPRYIEQFNIDKSKALDLGCGPAARSTIILDEFCGQVIACDMSCDVIKYCQRTRPQFSLFNDNNNGKYKNAPFSVIFSIFSFCRFGYEKELLSQFRRCYESLISNGFLIIVSGSEALYTKEFSSVKSHTNSNEPLAVGKKVGINIKSIDCDVFDFYWPSSVLIDLAKEAGFKLAGLLYPRGYKKDNQMYTIEYQCPPYFHLILNKNNS